MGHSLPYSCCPMWKLVITCGCFTEEEIWVSKLANKLHWKRTESYLYSCKERARLCFIKGILVHVIMRQLQRQMQTFIEKKHYYFDKVLLTWVLYGIQILYFNPIIFCFEHLSLVENTVKHIHFRDHRQEVNAL